MTTARTGDEHFVDRLLEAARAPDRQLVFEGVERRESQAGRGASFEKMIERAHHSYRVRGLAVVERNKRVWDYTSKAKAEAVPEFMAAATLDGRHHLKMEASLVDFAGTARGRSLRFDAKETGKPSIPLDAFTRHQVEELCDHERADGLAGFLVHFTLTGEVFWVQASKVRRAQDLVLFQKGRGRHPKSFGMEWMRAEALHVYTVRHECDSCDYLPALLETGGAPR